MISVLSKYLPKTFNTYYEPFCGGAALFFAIRPDEAVLSDRNIDLINTYKAVACRPDDVIHAIEKFENTEPGYYHVRSLNPTDPIDQAARFLYLCRLAFNGIYRVNLKGMFNVPYGHKTHLQLCDPEQIREISKALKKTILIAGDFEKGVESAVRGDFIYLDPPYTVAHSNNGFVKYNDVLFSWDDQMRLAKIAEQKRMEGIFVLVSNAAHETIQALYPKFEYVEIERFSIIAADKSRRSKVKEAILIGRPL